MITAEEFYLKDNSEKVCNHKIKTKMIEFAKLHCIEQAKVISENADFTEETYQSLQEGSVVDIDKDSIINAST